MATHVPESPLASSQPSRSTRAGNRRTWSREHPARLAAVLLLWVWVGPVTIVQTDTWQLLKWLGAGRAAAESQVVPAGLAMVLEPGTILKLRMHDGSVLEGRFQARTLLDSALYAPRFAENARTSAYVPFALGETLRVSLRDGREWTGPFAGYAELTLLLGGIDGQYLRVPFESAIEFHRANGNRVEPSDLAQAFRAGRLPSAEALELQEQGRRSSMTDKWHGARLVAVEDIDSATVMESPAGGGTSGGAVAGIVVLSVALAVVLIVVLNHSSKPHVSSCDVDPTIFNFSEFRLTTRPFDRSRGCYEGDALASADPLPGSIESGAVGALDDPTTLRAPAR